MVLGTEGLGGEGELVGREGGWGGVLVLICGDLTGRAGIPVSAGVVKSGRIGRKVGVGGVGG